ncbi:MAG TPA: hypothetical protein VER58_14120 [Thermoanaerobaculia bacterium]|nr:hypothetical protein [Thermoanaerobaculia bacterium]
MKKLFIAATALIAVVAYAQEHPEHPKNKPAPKQSRAYTMDELEKAITAEIQNAQKADGAYHVKDGDKTWNLTLDHVHTERLARVDPKTYFACVDFKSDDNHTVDVDFFMKDDGEKLVLSDASLHKVDGKARYNWQEKDGYWVKVPAK